MMKSWEFLIQKKGINSWFPLNTQKLKLSAGTYRMVAQSHRPHLDVEIRITHLLEETPPKRRSQKRLARTNQEGLLALVPFIKFSPGLWQICCSCDVMSELLGEPWQEVVQIRVEPQSAIAPEETTPNPIEETEELEANLEPLSPESDVAVGASNAPSFPLEATKVDSTTPETETAPSPLATIVPSTEDLGTSLPEKSANGDLEQTEEAEKAKDPEDINSLLDRSIENLEQILRQASQPHPEEIDEPELSAPALPSSQPPPIPAEIANLPLRLTLYHDSFVRHQDEAILIAGQVDAVEPQGDRLHTLFSDLDGIDAQLLLRYHLRDPQSSSFYDSASGWEATPAQVLFDSKQATSEVALPQVFGYHLQILPEYRAPLILGEAILEISFQQPSGGSRAVAILARHPFTIAAALDELLEAAFPSDAPPQVSAETLHASELESPAATINTDFVELARNASQARQFQPTPPQILPPKLSAGSPKPTSQLVQLPEFQVPQLADGEEERAEIAELAESEEAILETDDSPAVSLDEEAENQGVAASQEELGMNPDRISESPVFLDPPESSDEESAEPSELDSEFQSLRLQDRFWSRMNSLAEDAPSFAAENLSDDSPATSDLLGKQEGEASAEVASSEQLEEETPTESVVVNPAPEVELPLANLISPSPDLPFLGEGAEIETETETIEEDFAIEEEAAIAADGEADWIDREIVVEDEEDLFSSSPLKHDASGLPYPADVKVSARKPMGEVERNLDAPVAAPILEVSEGELVAGDPVIVRVKLLPHPDAVYVKLWVQDCQTRHLLDGPRAFVDFTPNQAGELETVTQLLVPLGSLEIRFEAIAIDIETQRESHKAIVERRVMPPDLER